MGAQGELNLLDADVLIELQRGSEAALEWASANSSLGALVPGVVAIEFVVGSRNKRERERAQAFLDRLNIAWMTEADHERAYALASRYGLSTGLNLADLMIAAQAINNGAVLWTFNLKHYRAVEGLTAQAPYQRN